TVAPDQPDGFARIGGERHIGQRVDVAALDPPARDEHLLRRPHRLRVDAEPPADVVDLDRSSCKLRLGHPGERSAGTCSRTSPWLWSWLWHFLWHLLCPLSGTASDPVRPSACANQLDEPGEDARVGAREDAVTEVEDMAGTAGCPTEDVEGAGL